jgi:hypothetical protein
MPSPFPVIFFNMIQFTLYYSAIYVCNVAKPAHIPVLFQNTQNLKWRVTGLGKQCGKSSLISMTSNMKVHTLDRKSIGVSIMNPSVFIVFNIKNVMIQSVSNLTEGKIYGNIFCHSHYQKICVRCHREVKLYILK